MSGPEGEVPVPFNPFTFFPVRVPHQLRELCSEKSTSQLPCYCNQSDHLVLDESVYSTTPITTANRKATPM